MFDESSCEGRKGPIPMGDEGQGEVALRPFFTLHDYLYLEDEMHAPIEESNDAAVLAMEDLEREYDRLLAQQAVVAEKIEAGRIAFRNQRDMIVVDSGSPRFDGDEALRRAYSSEVATRLHVSDRSATNLIEESKTVLNDLPELADAWRLGWVSQQHVRSAVRQAWELPAEARAGFDAAVVARARTQTPSRFQSTARKTREKLHPESIETRKKNAFAERQVEVFEAADGMAGVTLHHSAEIVLSIEDQVRALAKRRKNETSGENRTLTQLGADIVAEALMSQLGMETLRIGAFGQDLAVDPGTGDGSSSTTGSSSDTRRSSAKGLGSAGVPEAYRESEAEAAVASDAEPAADISRSATPAEQPADPTTMCTTDPSTNGASSNDVSGEGTSAGAAAGTADTVGFTSRGDGQQDAGLTAAQLAALRPGVVITVPAATLLGQSDEPAELNGYGPLDWESASELMLRASSFHRVLTSPVDGSTVAIDPNKYRLSEQVKRLIRTRDVTCGFPGCDVPAHRCDIDHIVAWEDGGRSTLDNLIPLCRRHHSVKHSTRWRSESRPDGSILWTSPTGATYSVTRGEVREE